MQIQLEEGREKGDRKGQKKNFLLGRNNSRERRLKNMPQDGQRSALYRSFFSCDDPKGVVECKTNRKSKTDDSHKLEDKVEHQKKQKNLSKCKSFSLNGERNDTGSKGPTNHELHSPSSYQLMQISRGARRLNQVIDTWSKEISFDRQSGDIAKDLLREALDLKESLAMLGKLQEASQVMAKLKKKQKEKGGGKLDAAGIERTTSDRFGCSDRRMLEFENSRLSVDGSARDCFEELRDAIKESFARQNLLPKNYNEEKPHTDRLKPAFLLDSSSPDLLPKSSKEKMFYFDKTKSNFSWDPSSQNLLPKNSKEEKAEPDFSQDLPSTSSSQSSHFFSYEFDSSDSSISKSQEMKPKAPSVIAKLMGLEELSPRRLQSYPQKHYGKEKALNQGRTTFDIDLPKARRPHFTVQKADPQPRTLEELTETIQFKGLMSSTSPHRPEHLSDISYWRKEFTSDAPPIVIIKPLHVSDLLDEEVHMPKHEDLAREKRLRKWKMKEGIPPRSNTERKGALKLSEIHRKERAEKSPGKRAIQERGEKDFGQVRENRDSGNAVARKEDKSIKRQEKTSSALVKASAPVKPKIQKKEVTEQTVPRIQKSVPNTRNPTEVETEKSRDASKSLQPNKLASAYLRKPECEPFFSKVRISQEKGAMSDTMAECFAETTSRSSNVQKKNVKKEKEVGEPSRNLVGSNKISSDNIESASESVQDVTAKFIIPSQQLHSDEEKDVSGNLGASYKKNTSYVGAPSKPVPPNSGIKTIEAANRGISYNVTTEKKESERSNTMKDLLLGSTSFLNGAEELFDIYSSQPTDSHIASSHDYGTAEIKVLLECAKELLENRSRKYTVAVHPTPNIFFKESKIRLPLDQLVNEICDGIEFLRSYYKMADKGLVVHKLCTVLQKDMWCKGVANGAWDLGWSKGFTRDEIDQVVVDIEQNILSGIIEDLLRDGAVY